jgi:hypothetical protein
MKKQEVYIPQCWVCMDRGFILYQKQIGDTKAEYAAHCTCRAGEAYRYDGAKCEKKSEYRIPSIVEVLDPQRLAAENFRVWWEANKKKDGIVKAMKERGIPIPKDAA